MNVFKLKRISKAAFVAVLLGGASLGTLAQAQTLGDTEVSAMIFLNASQQEQAAGDDNFNFDMKRLFINVAHQFDHDWSLHVTTDFQWQRQQDPADPILRHFYVQRKIGDSMRLKLGNAATPWILPIAQINGYRYLDPGLIPRAGHGHAADWGVHLEGEVANFGYAVAAVTGGGFQKPRVGDSVDFEGRVYWQLVPGLQLHLGGYHGTLTQDKDDRPKFHTAQRWNTAMTYNQGRWRGGVQYFYADNWRQINQIEEDSASGYSLWGAYQINTNFALALRHDQTSPSRRLDTTRVQDYYHAALEWRYNPRWRFSAVVKHIDNVTDSDRRINNEFGLWAQILL